MWAGQGANEPPRSTAVSLLRHESAQASIDRSKGQADPLAPVYSPRMSPSYGHFVPAAGDNATPVEAYRRSEHGGTTTQPCELWPGSGEHGRKGLTRVSSFPVRRASFDRIVDQLQDAGEHADEPADGPHFTNTVSASQHSSSGHSNSDSSNRSVRLHRRDTRSQRLGPDDVLNADEYVSGSDFYQNEADSDAWQMHRRPSAGSDPMEPFALQEWSQAQHLSDFGAATRGARGQDVQDGAACPGSPDEERDGLCNWKYLMSLIKAKLLANNGRGRKITILCGGFLSITYERTLRRYPGTLLTSMVTEEDGALKYADKIMLDRHPIAFVEILNAYREGVIAGQPSHIAPETWIHELAYFRMHLAGIPAINDLLQRYGIHKDRNDANDPLAGLNSCMRHAYNFFEEPSSSWPAWFLSIISLTMILASVVLVCIETLPEIESNAVIRPYMDMAELVIIIFFTVEFVCRFLVANRKVLFWLQPMNLVDVVAIAPSWFLMAFPAWSQLGAARVFRILRVLRIFKLSRHSQGLQVLAKTGTACRDELGLLLFCLVVFSLLFSSLLFFSEFNIPGTGFESIPHTMWWAVVTITTVGYGDLSPESTLGRYAPFLCKLACWYLCPGLRGRSACDGCE